MPDDNHEAAWIILTAIGKVSVCKYKLASFLKGSKFQEIDSVPDEQVYDDLLRHSTPVILNFIKQLERMNFIQKRYVQLGGFQCPVLELLASKRSILYYWNQKVSLQNSILIMINGR